jgi:hypothetical protein
MITEAQRHAMMNIGLPLPLINDILKQIGSTEAFIELAPKIAQTGAQEGYAGFTFFEETIPFAKKHREEIMDIANEEAKLSGTSAFALKGIHGHVTNGISKTDLAGAIYLPSHPRKEHAYNALALYILERAAYKYCQALNQ